MSAERIPYATPEWHSALDEWRARCGIGRKASPGATSGKARPKRRLTAIPPRPVAANVPAPLPANVVEMEAPKRFEPAAMEQPCAHGPNQTEQDYYDEHLAPRLASGELTDIRFEGVTLRLSEATHELVISTGKWRRRPALHYTADWAAWRRDGRLELHECKGKHAWEDAKLKYREAIDRYPLIAFWWAQRDSRGEAWNRCLCNPLPALVASRPTKRPAKPTASKERSIQTPPANGAEGAAVAESQASDKEQATP